MNRVAVVTCLLLSAPALGDATVPGAGGGARPSAAAESLEYTAEELHARLSAAPGEARRVSLYRITFRPGTAELVFPASEPTLREILRLARRMGFMIIAHTDERGSEKWNQRLSVARAKAVLGWLIARGADPKQIFAFGAGEDHPLVAGHNAAAWAKNARIDLSTAWP